MTQISTAISQLQSSMNLIMQNLGPSRPQNPSGSQEFSLSKPGFGPTALPSQQFQNQDSKNYQTLNQNYPVY